MSSPNPLIIHVLPQLKPTQCGVSDFALALARELESGFGIDSAFAIVNSDFRCDVPYPRINGSQAELLEACLSLSQGKPGTLLVHVSGYGYSRDGAPAELAQALARVRASGQFRIAGCFHELFATSAPWRKAFWYSRRQKNAVRKVANECDLVVTNSLHHAHWLERESQNRSQLPVQALPVFSNVGEAIDPVPMERRTPSLVILGLPASRIAAYDRLSSLGGLLEDLGIHEIVDVGPAFNIPSTLHNRPVRQLGVVPAPELSDLLGCTRFGFVKHPAFTLAKSGIFAAYCAHGTVPIVPDPFSTPFDGLEDGIHVISPLTAKRAAAGLQRISTAAWEWHFPHRLRIHAETYARLVAQPSNGRTATAVASVAGI